MVLVALGRSSWWENCACDRHDFVLRSHRRGTLCYGLYPCARLLPRSPPVEVHDLSPRFGVVDSAQTATDCLGDVGPVGTCHASWITPPLQIISIRSNWKMKSFGTSFSIRSDRVAISLSPIYKCLLGDSFFDESHETSSRFESIRFEKFSSLTRALKIYVRAEIVYSVFGFMCIKYVSRTSEINKS